MLASLNLETFPNPETQVDQDPGIPFPLASVSLMACVGGDRSLGPHHGYGLNQHTRGRGSP